MHDPQSLFIARTLFSDAELLSLKAFYAGEKARSIRKRLPNPWPLIARHSAQDRYTYQAIKALLDSMEVAL